MNSSDLAHRLGALAVELQQETGTEATLAAIVSSAVTLVPGAHWAGISFIDGKQVVPRVPSNPIVEKLDRLQSDLDDGPCMDALRDHRTVHIEDMGTELRWPGLVGPPWSRVSAVCCLSNCSSRAATSGR